MFSKNPKTSDGRTRQLDYYKEKNTTRSSYSAAIKKYNNIVNNWWLSTVNNYDQTSYFAVSDKGVADNQLLLSSSGALPPFQIG